MPERPAGAPLLLGVLVLLLAACTPLGDPAGAQPSVVVTPPPSPSPDPPGGDTEPSASSLPTPSPTATPTADLAAGEELELEVTGCPGGVVVDWSATAHPEFHHYIALRSIEPEVNVAYPPIAPAVDWGDSYATDRFVTSAVDATLIPSDTILYYRVMAYDEVNRVLASSPVRSTHPYEVADIGPLTVEPAEEGAETVLDWTLFGGLGRCFSTYQVLIGPAGGVPASTLTSVAHQAESELRTSALQSGQTYTLRVDAVRTTTLGSFVVGRSEVTTYTVP